MAYINVKRDDEFCTKKFFFGVDASACEYEEIIPSMSRACVRVWESECNMRKYFSRTPNIRKT